MALSSLGNVTDLNKISPKSSVKCNEYPQKSYSGVKNSLCVNEF